MIARRGFLGILTGAVAAPLVVRADLLTSAAMPMAKAPALSLDEFVQRYIDPAVARLADEILSSSANTKL